MVSLFFSLGAMALGCIFRTRHLFHGILLHRARICPVFTKYNDDYDDNDDDDDDGDPMGAAWVTPGRPGLVDLGFGRVDLGFSCHDLVSCHASCHAMIPCHDMISCHDMLSCHDMTS